MATAVEALEHSGRLSLTTAGTIVALSRGLERFPERGRRVPELRDRPEYELVREIILPRKARILYMFIPDSDEAIILGILAAREQFRLQILGPYFS